jgi:hypothetical protein
MDRNPLKWDFYRMGLFQRPDAPVSTYHPQMASRVKLPSDFKATLKALLNTPPPPPGDPSTRKVVKKKRKVKNQTVTRRK